MRTMLPMMTSITTQSSLLWHISMSTRHSKRLPALLMRRLQALKLKFNCLHLKDHRFKINCPSAASRELRLKIIWAQLLLLYKFPLALLWSLSSSQSLALQSLANNSPKRTKKSLNKLTFTVMISKAAGCSKRGLKKRRSKVFSEQLSSMPLLLISLIWWWISLAITSARRSLRLQQKMISPFWLRASRIVWWTFLWTCMEQELCRLWLILWAKTQKEPRGFFSLSSRPSSHRSKSWVLMLMETMWFKLFSAFLKRLKTQKSQTVKEVSALRDSLSSSSRLALTTA